jgi:hypothetical protein
MDNKTTKIVLIKSKDMTNGLIVRDGRIPFDKLQPNTVYEFKFYNASARPVRQMPGVPNKQAE